MGKHVVRVTINFTLGVDVEFGISPVKCPQQGWY